MRGAAIPVLACLVALGACRHGRTPAGARGAVYRSAWVPGMTGSNAVREGRGALFGDRRVELSEGPPSHWSLLVGRLGDLPSRVDLPAMEGCTWPDLAYIAGSLVYACTPPGQPPPPERFFRSTPTGAAFTELPSLRQTRFGTSGAFTLSPGDELLLINMCAPGAPCPANRVERGENHILVRRTDGTLERATLAGSELDEVFTVRATPGGDVYAVARENGMPFLAVSRDRGRTFVRHDLPPVTEGPKRYDASSQGGRANRTLYVEDGGTVVVLTAEDPDAGWFRYVSTDYGQHFDVRRVPIPADAIDLAGRRGFAYAATEHGTTWETNDAGATWHPVTPAARDPRGHMSLSDLVACGDAGCLFDASRVRLGWDLPTPASGPVTLGTP